MQVSQIVMNNHVVLTVRSKLSSDRILLLPTDIFEKKKKNLLSRLPMLSTFLPHNYYVIKYVIFSTFYDYLVRFESSLSNKSCENDFRWSG